MKAFFTTVILLLPIFSFALSPVDTAKGVKISFGLSTTIFYDRVGQYTYILQPNSKPLEENNSHVGFMLSTAAHFEWNDNWALILNLPIEDFTPSTNFFNKNAVGGAGVDVRLIKHSVYVTAMVNYGEATRMTKEALASQQFPTAIYPTLKVNQAIPSDTISPYTEKVPKVIFNLGLIIYLR